MNNEIVINGVTYVRKDIKKASNYAFKKGCEYFTFFSSNPDYKLKILQKKFPKMNSFFVGKQGYCGKVCLEVGVDDITVDFLKKLLTVSDNFFNIIDNQKKFNMMVDEEMKRPDLH